MLFYIKTTGGTKMGSFVDVVVLEVGVFDTRVIDDAHVGINEPDRLKAQKELFAKKYNKSNQMCLDFVVNCESKIVNNKLVFSM
jgi:hypothetical protein